MTETLLFQFPKQEAILIQTLISESIEAGVASVESMPALATINFHQTVELTNSQRFDLRCFLQGCLGLIGQASLQDQDLVLRLAEEVATLESAIILISTDQDGLIDALAEAYGSI